MDFYNSWIYRHFLNKEWFIWGVVIVILGGNLLFPVLVRMLLGGKPIFRKRKKNV